MDPSAKNNRQLPNMLRIIAEFCQNHNGDYETLKRMIHSAADAGATHAKIQTIFADDLSFRPEFETGRKAGDGRVEVIKRPYQEEYERLKRLELNYKEHEEFIAECLSCGLKPMTTAFNLRCIPELESMGWDSIKVASYDCGSLPLIKELASRFSELIVSTGASYDDEIVHTSKLLQSTGVTFSLLHCVTVYPTPLDMMNLNRLSFLRGLCESVGLSNHSLTSRDGIKADLVAVYLGASIIERHFSILPEDQTKDGPVSIGPSHIKELVAFNKLSVSDRKAYLEENVGDYDLMLGTVSRELSDLELLNRSYYRGRFCNRDGEKQIFNWEEDAYGILQNKHGG